MKDQLFLAFVSAFVAVALAADQCGKRNTNPALMSALQPDYANYISGGRIATKNEFPWQISIQVTTRSGETSRKHICGASLVNDRWVVTAAHCIIDGVQKQNYYIVAGAQRLDDTAFPIQSRRAFQIVVHPLWNRTTLQNDIALIQLDSQIWIREASVAPICLPETTDAKRFNGTCVTSGWGALYPNTAPSPSLVKVDLPIVSNEDCANHHRNTSTTQITKDELCAGKPGAGPCHADGGNPLACEENGVYYLAGITSLFTCGSSQYPSVFTRVSSYRTWIDVHIS